MHIKNIVHSKMKNELKQAVTTCNEKGPATNSHAHTHTHTHTHKSEEGTVCAVFCPTG